MTKAGYTENIIISSIQYLFIFSIEITLIAFSFTSRWFEMLFLRGIRFAILPMQRHLVQYKGVLVALLYMLTSVVLILFNKVALSVYDFSFIHLLTLLQALCSAILMIGFKKIGLITFHDFSMKNFWATLPLGISFVVYMILGMFAIQVVNIPMYTTLRRTTALFVMVAEYIFLGKSTSNFVQASVGIMIVGALLAGIRDLQFDIISYLIVLCYNCSTAIYLVLINRTCKLTGLGNFDLMYYNSLITIPVLGVYSLFSNEIFDCLQFEFLFDRGFLMALSGSCIMAFFLNYTIFWNTLVNSPLTQNVSGQTKDVLTVILGFILFTNDRIDRFNLLGVLIGFVGGLLYAFAKWKKL